MTPYLQAWREALYQGLLLLEGAVTQPIGLAHDLRTLRIALQEALRPGQADERASAPWHVSRPPLERALETVAMARRSAAHLAAMEGLDPGWTERASGVLLRVEARLGSQRRQSLAARFRGLYVLLDPQMARSDPLEVAAAALEGGACAIQWRDKLRDKGDQLPTCLRLAELCSRHNALLIVNDHADLAAACGAHGVHVGQHDLPIAEARRALAPDQLLGRSNATLEEARESQAAGADYIAVGAIYPSPSKSNTRTAGLETLRQVRRIAQVPLVAISGITEANVAEVIAAGADAVAVISAVVAAQDPRQAASRLVERIEAARSRRDGNP